ncbi:MAG: hypothetical protein JJU45_01285 [Acidimicrobiia bacterium]|nr:hypothetical protein [Acidimicrobiia bacterium]
MHPIEHLRFVARADGVAGDVLVRQTAAALASFTDDPTALVTACRRVVVRQPHSAVLAWFCSRVLTAIDPADELWSAVGALEADCTAAHLADLLAPEARVVVLGPAPEVAAALGRRADVTAVWLESDGPAGGSSVGAVVPALSWASAVLVEAEAVGGAEALASAGALPVAAVAHHLGVPVWLVVPEGRVLASSVWPAFRTRALNAECDEPLEVVPAELVDRVVRPVGEIDVAELARAADAPAAPELFGAGPGHL